MSLHENDNVIAFGAPHDGADDPLFEARLRRALEVPVPADLVESILLRQTTEARHAPRMRRLAPLWRVAAGFALAVGALGLFLSSSAPVQALPELVVDHTLHHEPDATARRARVAPSQIRALFARSGTVLNQVPADVTYINLCELGRDLSLHMVSQQNEGPVTVYYVPGRIELHRMDFRQSGMTGRSLPMARGVLVLLAANDAAFDRLESSWRSALEAVPGALN